MHLSTLLTTALAAGIGAAWKIEYFSDNNCKNFESYKEGLDQRCLSVMKGYVGKMGSVKWHGDGASVWLNKKCTTPADPHGPTVYVDDGDCIGVVENTYFYTPRG